MEDNTFLFEEIIFGPVTSRRLGKSLGINLLPLDSKFCNFDCIYCECGWTDFKTKSVKTIPTRTEVYKKLELTLQRLREEETPLQHITFAGNGEPTLHPFFSKIIRDTVFLRDKYFPECKIAVLSNATTLNNKRIVEALKLADKRIMKLDAGTEDTFRKINKPVSRRTLRWTVDHLHYFKNKLIVQTMFVKGRYDDQDIDNTSTEEVDAWLQLINEVKPESVMIYSLDRSTPAKELEKIPSEKLNEIALMVNMLGIKAQVN